MANAFIDGLYTTSAKVFLMKTGQVKDLSNENNFHPNANVNGLFVHIEDGVSTNIVTLNFAPSKKPNWATHDFPLLYIDTIEHTIVGELTPRTFARYFNYMPSQLLAMNLNSSSIMDVGVTVKQQSGANVLGAFNTLSALQAEYNNQEVLEGFDEDNTIAYVYEVGENGYYMVDFNSVSGLYEWVLKTNDYSTYLSTKPYNMFTIKVQRGYQNTKPITTLEDEQYRLLWAYMGSFAGLIEAIGNRVTTLEEEMDIAQADIIDLQDQIDKVVDGTTDIAFDKTGTDLSSDFVEDAIKEVNDKTNANAQNITDMKDGTDAFSEILLGTAQIRYNATKKIVEQVFDDGTTMEVGLELWAIARNEDTTILKNGEVGAINGVVGQQLSVIHADPSNDLLHFKELGVCTMEGNIAINGVGKITHFGEVNNIPVANFEVTGTAYAENQELFVSVNGKLTNVAPAEPIAHIHAGWVLRITGSNANIFVYFVKVPHLEHLSDVSVTDGAEHDILIRGSDGVWRNSQRLVTAESEITKIKDGTTIVKKAEQDKNGNDIVETYATNDRVDNIIVGTIEGASAQEIIDARQGEVTLGANITKVKSQLADMVSQNLVADIQAKSYKIGDKIFSKLYGGSYWEVKSTVTLEGYTVNFTDELHIVVNIVGGGTGIAECQITSVIPYAKQINTTKTAEVYGKLKRRQTVKFDAKGDSITYGQNNSTGIDRNGVATNFGDGSTFNTNKQDANPFPSVLQTTLNDVYGASTVSINNHGYSGDTVGQSYTRHRNLTDSDLTTILLGVNDMLSATANGATPNNAVDSSNRWCVQNFVSAYRKYIVRELLRGKAVILMTMFKFSGSTGFDTTVYSATKIMQMYNNAIKELGKELGLLVVDLEDFIGGYVNGTMLNGVHPTSTGYDLMGKRLASVFVNNGHNSIDKIYGERQITGVAFGENLIWGGLTGDSKAGFEYGLSYQYAYSSAGNSYDYYLNIGDAVYYSFYLEKDGMAIMPIGSLTANGSLTYELDFGITQPEFKLDVADTQTYNDRSVPLSSVTLAPTATTRYNSHNDISNHLIIRDKGWHTLKLSVVAQSFIFEGLRLFNINAYDKIIKQSVAHGTTDNFLFSNLSIMKDGGHYRLLFAGADFSGGAIKLFLNGNETETNYYNCDEGGAITNSASIINSPGTGGFHSTLAIDIYLGKATEKPTLNATFIRWSSTSANNTVRRTMLFNVASNDITDIKLKLPANMYISSCELQRF